MDTFVSLFNVIATGSHSESILDSDFEVFKEEFEGMVMQEMTVWNDYYNYWLN